MGLNLDSSRPLRTYDQLKLLVQAIHASDDPGGENASIEWKSFLDLGKPAGAFHAARAILGFANRSVSSAANRFGGLGYLVVGVEPGSVQAMPRWDGERLGPALARYLGPSGPEWSHENITFEGQNVLVLTVEAPAVGQAIYTLRKEFSGHDASGVKAAPEGTIFVRHGGRTDRATSADIEALQHRLLASAASERLHVSLDDKLEGSYRAGRIDLHPEEVESWIEQERRSLLLPMRESKSPRSLLGAELRILNSEQRTEDEFRREVERYLDRYRDGAPELLRHALSKSALARNPLQPSVRNDDEDALEDVLVEISTPVAIQQFFVEGSWQELRRPREWGSFPNFSAVNSFDVSAFDMGRHPQAEQQQDRWVSRQHIPVLHGETTFNLAPFTVLTEEPLDEGSISIRITARSRRGSAEFRVPVNFAVVVRAGDFRPGDKSPGL